MEPASSPVLRAPHPAEVTNARAQAEHQSLTDADARRLALDEWLVDARVQLQKLPNDLTDDIADMTERQAARRKVEAAVSARIAELGAAVELHLGDMELLGWAHVTGAAVGEDQGEDVDSEVIAMQHVTRVLNADTWAVADVHTERVGYDLKATRGPKVRMVEVKGLKGSAASRGIIMTGAELATAGINGDDYWLYVVDHCEDGKGTLFGAWPDPAAVFAEAVKDVSLLRIPGSELDAARETKG
jgi:hypothetical protein